MLLIYLPGKSSRCDYIFDLIFLNEFGLDYRVTTDITEFEYHPDEKINYSHSRISNAFFIRASSLVFENQIRRQEISVERKHETTVLFPNDNDDLKFDIFSAVFYLISRYEEYLPFAADKFGRFNAEDSLAYKNDFLHLPIADIWINIFKNALQKRFPSLRIKPRVFNTIVTYDIDVAYKYRGRGFLRTTGSILKDILFFKIKNIGERIDVLRKNQKDPWDVYADLATLILRNNLKSVFFFLMADKSKHDRNLNYQDPAMKELVSDIAKLSEIGIHPSFFSSSFPEKILIEKKRLENLSEKNI